MRKMATEASRHRRSEAAAAVEDDAERCHSRAEHCCCNHIPVLAGGKQMSDDKKASEYNIEGGSVLHLVLALRGGC